MAGVTAQAEGHIRHLIGQLAPGERLPSERQLSSDLGVARTTVRLILERLTVAGMVTRRHGSGNFRAYG
jgi:DNA-binding FadR family transcriptional regulator